MENQTGDKDYFDNSIFDEEILTERQGVGEEIDEDENEPDHHETIAPEIEHFEISKMFLSFIDQTRALVCAMITDEDKDKYTFYTEKQLNDNNFYMVKAGAEVARKYQLKFGAEFILLMGILGSTLYIANQARKDRKAKKGSKKKKETETPQIEIIK